MDRYIISYEPFNFKGNIQDFPLTVDYGEKVDALRRRYRDYLWDAEFRDTLGASVKVAGSPYHDYTVFLKKDGRRAVVVANDDLTEPIHATISLQKQAGHTFICASPERPETAVCSPEVTIDPRSAFVMMMEQ